MLHNDDLGKLIVRLCSFTELINWLIKVISLWLVALYCLALLGSEARADTFKIVCENDKNNEWFNSNFHRINEVTIKIYTKVYNNVWKQELIIDGLHNELNAIYQEYVETKRKQLLESKECVEVGFSKKQGGAE